MRALAAALLALVVGCDREPARVEEDAGAASTLQRPARLPRPVSMEALHRSGGVPPGWSFGVPPGDPAAGRNEFLRLGCDSCHTVEPDPAAGVGGLGPDLAGMGSHHPPEYFAEAILNPDAVLVDGPGYLGEDGRSIMPVYPDMTLAQLADLVAYLQTLTAPADHHAHLGHAPSADSASGVPPPAGLPRPPATDATVFLVQTYDVKDGALEAFEEWFAREGAAFLDAEGFVGLDTYVDATRGKPVLTTVFAFRDADALAAFSTDPELMLLGEKFDSFVGPHGHLVVPTPPLYRVDALSTP